MTVAGRKPAGADQLPSEGITTSPGADAAPGDSDAGDPRDARIAELEAQVSGLQGVVSDLEARIVTLQGWLDASDDDATPPAEEAPQAPEPPQRQTGHAMARRRGEPGREYLSVPVRGPAIRLVADASGIVTPITTEEVRLADELRLPVIPDSQES